MTSDEPPLWRAILARLDPPPASTSIDSVTEALGGAVGRGTIQRIRDGVPGTSMKSLNAIAKRLGCSAGELLGEELTTAGARTAAELPSVRLALMTIRNQLVLLPSDQADAAGEALKLMAKVPDSGRAFEHAVNLLTSDASRR
jgi:hypothetical protein